MKLNGTMSHIILDHNAVCEADVKTYEVSTITFDDLISDLHISPAALQMDIEGSEKFALRSADHALLSVRYIECEIHDSESEGKLLRNDGFRFEKSRAENMGNAIRYLLCHPLKVLNMKMHNGSVTSRRVLFSKSAKTEICPKIFFGYKET